MDKRVSSRLFLGQYYPPMELFENDPTQNITRKLLSACNRLVDDKAELDRNFGELLDHTVFGVYGSAVYGLHEPNDIDIIIFTGTFSGRRQHFLDIQNLGESDDRKFDFTFANDLIIFPAISQELYREIEFRRNRIMESEFFQGGIGDLITNALYRILWNGENVYLDGKSYQKAREIVVGKLSERVSSMQMLGACMHPTEFYSAMREGLVEIKPKELKELTIAALKRIKVKNRLRGEIATRYVRAIANSSG